MWFAGHGGQSDGDVMQVRLNVGGGGGSAPVGVPGVGAGYSVPEVAFDPGESGVAQPVGGDALHSPG